MTFSIRLLGCVCLGVLSPSLFAQDIQYGADVSLVSNQIFRGRSLSDKSGDLQATLHISNDKGWSYRFFATSYENFLGDKKMRGEASLDYRSKSIDGFDYVFGFKRYFSPDGGIVINPLTKSYTNEVYVGITYKDVLLTYHQDDDADTNYTKLSYKYELMQGLKLSAHYGINSPIYEGDDANDYGLEAVYHWNEDLSFYGGATDHEVEGGHSYAGVTYRFW
ncbi:TorF family putative porin [Pleionea sp. CnH1-48]|uniref:TorF family putative porin n=1 Tax=Pleionea sp. CnH1-48 TaxID=2954494 RepID=UPI0020974CB5|nr:TorF family putative porin [Pleionea sp. CnH1-48]MCO7225829.1 hypothetical protein [Pleionea sp. CnH1-48]